MQIWINN